MLQETEAKGGDTSLVVSHGSAIPTILTISTPESYYGESIGNPSLALLHYEDGKFSLVKVGRPVICQSKFMHYAIGWLTS